jgi:hypothetical protein
MTAKSRTDINTELTTNFADNTNGDITASDFRTFATNVLDSVAGCYGALYVSGGSTAQSLTDTPAKVTGFAVDGVSDNTTPAHADDQITVDIAGVYLIQLSITGTGTSTDNYIFTPAVDGTAVANVSCGITGSAQASTSCVCLVSLSASEVVTVLGESNQGGGSNFTVQHAQLVITRVA